MRGRVQYWQGWLDLEQRKAMIPIRVEGEGSAGARSKNDCME